MHGVSHSPKALLLFLCFQMVFCVTRVAVVVAVALVVAVTADADAEAKASYPEPCYPQTHYVTQYQTQVQQVSHSASPFQRYFN